MAKNIDLKVRLKGAAKAKKGLGGVDNSLKSLGKSAMAAGAAFFGARAIIGGIKAVIKLAGEQEQAEKKLEVALGRTSRALLDQATALQQVTTFGDEAIIGVQASLAAFLDSEEAIKKATKATLDISVAMGMDLKASGDLVAKTLGSSTNAMSRYGIQVEGAVGSTERLESLTGNVAKLFGGQATGAAKTMAGSLQQMENAVGDAGEAIGTLLSPVVIGLAKDVKGLAEWWGEWLHNVENTKPSTMSENERTKKLSQEINKLTSEIEHRLEVLRDEELLKKRAEEQGNRISIQSGKERLQIAKLQIELKKLNEEKERQIEIESKKPPELPPAPLGGKAEIEQLIMSEEQKASIKSEFNRRFLEMTVGQNELQNIEQIGRASCRERV